MNIRVFSISALFLFTIITLAAQKDVRAEQDPFPAYGSGPVEVRVYSDYLCPPCQQLESALEPVFKKLAKKKNIKLVFVDFPGHAGSVLYTQYYLYALKHKNSAGEALRIRSILFRAAPQLETTTREKLEELFASRKIGYTVFDPKPVFKFYNSYITEDRIDTTPSCVIIKDGKKDKFTGVEPVAKALKSLI